jgi:hypothetical protein
MRRVIIFLVTSVLTFALLAGPALARPAWQ